MAFYLFRKIVFNCEQATLLILKKNEHGLSLKEKLKLFYHLLFCDPCKRFGTQTLIIDDAVHKCSEHLSHFPSHTLPEESKKKMQQLVDNLK
jgi:hypothetical protein